MPNLIDPSRLQTVFNYASTRIGRNGKPVTVGYIYQLIKAGKLEAVTIDGMQFVVLPAVSATPAAGGPEGGG